MTLHFRHVLKWSLECGGGGLDTVTMSPEGAGTLAQLSALSNLVHLSPVPLAAAAVVPGWPGCHGSLVRANHLPGPSVAAVTQSRSVTLPPAPAPPPGRGRAVLGPAAAARQLQRDLRLDYAGGQNIPGRQFFVLWKINIRYQLIGRLRTWYFRIFLGSQK